MASIGFVFNSARPKAVQLAEQTASWLVDHGHRTHILSAAPSASEGSAVPPDLDLAVSLGGDGTMLRTVDLVSSQEVPVLGVNLGHLGYLTVAEPSGLRAALGRFLEGDFTVEARMTFDVTLGEPPPGGNGRAGRVSRNALNDVVLQRSLVGHTIHTTVAVNGSPFLAFVSDSLILATPTGSTAYNLSARGPIVSPKARVSVLTPVAPHMLFDRSVVLVAEDEVGITASGEFPVEVVVDGWRTATLQPGQSVQCRQGEKDALLVTFESRDFHRILKAKFNLKDR